MIEHINKLLLVIILLMGLLGYFNKQFHKQTQQQLEQMRNECLGETQ